MIINKLHMQMSQNKNQMPHCGICASPPVRVGDYTTKTITHNVAQKDKVGQRWDNNGQ